MTRSTMLLATIGLCSLIQFLPLVAIGSRVETMVVFVLGTHAVGNLLGVWLFVCVELSWWRFAGLLGMVAICATLDEALNLQGSLAFFTVPIVIQATTSFVMSRLLQLAFISPERIAKGWQYRSHRQGKAESGKRSEIHRNPTNRRELFSGRLAKVGVVSLLIIGIGVDVILRPGTFLSPFHSWDVVFLCITAALISQAVMCLFQPDRHIVSRTAVPIVIIAFAMGLVHYSGFEWKFIVMYFAVNAFWVGVFMVVMHTSGTGPASAIQPDREKKTAAGATRSPAALGEADESR